jgi:hypothetical protein
MLCTDWTFAYLPEPFNVAHLYPGLCAARFPYSFMKITPETESTYVMDLARMLRFDFSWRDALVSTRSRAEFGRALEIHRTFREARRRRSRPLVKDPIALFSAERLADRFGMDVVVLIRHPAAFAGSIARLGWKFDFADFLRQPSLMEGDLVPFSEEIELAARAKPNIYAEAALLWKCIYTVVDRYRTERPNWLFVRHEDLCAEPATYFQLICEHTGVTFSEEMKVAIAESHSNENQVDAPAGAIHALMRNSKATIGRWREVLDPGDIATIRELVEPMASRYYSGEDWPR